MDLQDQLKNLFPDHQFQESETPIQPEFWLQEQPLLCKYEKRNGKPTTVISGYNGANSDFKKLTKEIKTKFSVGGSYKNEEIIIQGNYRDQIMELLRDLGFHVKRVGG